MPIFKHIKPHGLYNYQKMVRVVFLFERRLPFHILALKKAMGGGQTAYIAKW